MPVFCCRECGAESVIDFGPKEDSEGKRVGLCFEWGYESDHWAIGESGGPSFCMKRGNLFESEDGITVCFECLKPQSARTKDLRSSLGTR